MIRKEQIRIAIDYFLALLESEGKDVSKMTQDEVDECIGRHLDMMIKNAANTH